MTDLSLENPTTVEKKTYTSAWRDWPEGLYHRINKDMQPLFFLRVGSNLYYFDFDTLKLSSESLPRYLMNKYEKIGQEKLKSWKKLMEEKRNAKGLFFG